MGDSKTTSPNGSPAAIMSNPSGQKSRTDAEASRQSGKVTFPHNSARSFVSIQDDDDQSVNPFRMPPNNDIFMLRDKERQRKKQERIKQRSLRVHEKTTYATRINAKTAQMIRPADSDDEQEKSDEDDGRAVAVKDDPQFTLAVTRDRHVEKESLADYINKKREMFLVQYSLGVKRDEMRKLEEIAAAEEKKLEMAEQYLEEDAAMFDEFLKQNDQNSVDAIRAAEQETKAKLEKVGEIKKINAQMMAVKSEISKYEDTLKEYQLYKRFLEALTPREWLDDKLQAREKRRETKRIKREVEHRERKGQTPDLGTERSGVSKKGQKKGAGGRTGTVSRSSTSMTKAKTPAPGETDSMTSLNFTDSDEDSDEEPELYFTDPHQLLDIFAELEEQNLSLIQNSQETEEALEEMKQTINNTKRKMEKETHILTDQIDKLNNSIKREEGKAKDLETKSRMFSYGEFKAEDQEKMLAELNAKVELVYRSCIGDNEASIGTLQMLTNIENRLEELFAQIELMPQDKVETAEKAKEKERRLKMREEKMDEQRIHQEERVRKALERAKADPKKKTGRKVVARSEPPRLKRKEDDGEDQRNREEEELAYFFTE